MAKRPEVPSGAFEPKSTRLESKAEATSNVARSIIDAERKAQANKTERLRALRLAKEGVEAAEPPPKAPARRKRAK